MNAQEYNLNIRPGYGYSQTVKVSQDDIGRPLEFHLYDGMDLLSITVGSVITIHATKPSGLGFTETCTWSGSTASISTTESMTQESGAFPAELVITSGGDVLGTANFTFCVERSPHQDGTTDGTKEELDDLYTEVNQLKNDFNALGDIDAVKSALLAIAANATYEDGNGATYYQALYDALYATPPAEVVSISAVYTQGGTVYDTDSLDSLKSDLVVTATYDDTTTATISSGYTLSGTLAEGTSTITVTYEGKTATFNVTVSIGLDSIAYGTSTYRDIFITNNLFPMGDFESNMTEDANFHDADVTGYQYKIRAAGTPTRSTAESVSPSHSLKAFGSSSQQMLYKSDTKSLTSGEKFLICASVKVDRYTKGYAGVQVISPINNSVDNAIAYFQRTTTGFETAVAIFELTANRTGIGAYVGSWSSANLDCYVDDAIITPLPSGLSVEDATTLYNKYLGIRGAA